MAISGNRKNTCVQPQTPTSMQKSYLFVHSNKSFLTLNLSRQQSPLATTTASSLSSSSSGGIIKEPLLQLPAAKRLFMSPGRSKSTTAVLLANNRNLIDTTNLTSTTIANATTSGTATFTTTDTLKMPVRQQLQTQKPLTPLNKLRGLFSAYRERQDNSPLSISSVSPECLQ